jgi:hypothetical protein
MASEKVVAPPAFLLRLHPRVIAPTTLDEFEWLEVAGLVKAEAEQLLDWLENHGFDQRQVAMGLDNAFVVRYRRSRR